jgi:F-type H+-transporting ATPase subunit delta
MQSGSIAKRYARALIDLAREAGEIEHVLKELEVFEAYLEQSDALRQVLTNPSFSGDQRVAVLRDVLDTVKFSDLTRRFLLLVAEKRRMDIFGSILREYRNYYDEQQGLVRVTVISAVPLPQDLEKRLTAQIESLVNRKVVLTREIDPGILGGIVTRVGDLLFDGSLSTQLSRIKTALLQEQLS